MKNEFFFEEIFRKDPWADIRAGQYAPDSNSMFGDAEVIQSVIEIIRPQFVVEVGSWKGHSANFMADITKKIGLKSKIICVDTFLGSSEHWLISDLYDHLKITAGRPTVFESFQANTLYRKNDDCIFPLPTDAKAASSILKEKNFVADLIFIDAAHDYQSVSSDLNNFYPILGDEGTMFGDDYQEPQTADAAHDFAVKNDLKVLVASRKWVFVRHGDASKDAAFKDRGFVERTSRSGWIHP